MYPEKIKNEPGRNWYGDDYLNEKQFVHCYIHENYKMKMHAHQFYEINIIINGKGRHYIADTSLPAELGDVFVIPPEISHGYFTESRLDISHIIVKKSFIKRYHDELIQIPGYDVFFDIEPLIRRSSGERYNLRIGKEYIEDVKLNMKKIIEAEKSGAYMYENILVLNFISELSVLFKNKLKNDNCENAEIIAIMEFIKKNLNCGISLSDIAAYANMSPATLNRRFKAILGVPPMQYVLNCRICMAEELIEQKNYNKTEIAQMCGFYDLAHMNKYLQKC